MNRHSFMSGFPMMKPKSVVEPDNAEYIAGGVSMPNLLGQDSHVPLNGGDSENDETNGTGEGTKVQRRDSSKEERRRWSMGATATMDHLTSLAGLDDPSTDPASSHLDPTTSTSTPNPSSSSSKALHKRRTSGPEILLALTRTESPDELTRTDSVHTNHSQSTTKSTGETKKKGFKNTMKSLKRTITGKKSGSGVGGSVSSLPAGEDEGENGNLGAEDGEGAGLQVEEVESVNLKKKKKKIRGKKQRPLLYGMLKSHSKSDAQKPSLSDSPTSLEAPPSQLSQDYNGHEETTQGVKLRRRTSMTSLFTVNDQEGEKSADESNSDDDDEEEEEEDEDDEEDASEYETDGEAEGAEAVTTTGVPSSVANSNPDAPARQTAPEFPHTISNQHTIEKKIDDVFNPQKDLVGVVNILSEEEEAMLASTLPPRPSSPGVENFTGGAHMTNNHIHRSASPKLSRPSSASMRSTSSNGSGSHPATSNLHSVLSPPTPPFLDPAAEAAHYERLNAIVRRSELSLAARLSAVVTRHALLEASKKSGHPASSSSTPGSASNLSAPTRNPNLAPISITRSTSRNPTAPALSKLSNASKNATSSLHPPSLKKSSSHSSTKSNPHTSLLSPASIDSTHSNTSTSLSVSPPKPPFALSQNPSSKAINKLDSLMDSLLFTEGFETGTEEEEERRKVEEEVDDEDLKAFEEVALIRATLQAEDALVLGERIVEDEEVLGVRGGGEVGVEEGGEEKVGGVMEGMKEDDAAPSEVGREMKEEDKDQVEEDGQNVNEVDDETVENQVAEQDSEKTKEEEEGAKPLVETVDNATSDSAQTSPETAEPETEAAPPSADTLKDTQAEPSMQPSVAAT
ncbi:hypothetical protein HDV05_004975 [Chytridiales sp. JEL 0842]|nr:hypothetical protein HDV05_004975 [Chytridiales sp. JEL 0842]